MCHKAKCPHVGDEALVPYPKQEIETCNVESHVRYGTYLKLQEQARSRLMQIYCILLFLKKN